MRTRGGRRGIGRNAVASPGRGGGRLTWGRGRRVSAKEWVPPRVEIGVRVTPAVGSSDVLVHLVYHQCITIRHV